MCVCVLSYNVCDVDSWKKIIVNSFQDEGVLLQVLSKTTQKSGHMFGLALPCFFFLKRPCSTSPFFTFDSSPMLVLYFSKMSPNCTAQFDLV